MLRPTSQDRSSSSFPLGHFPTKEETEECMCVLNRARFAEQYSIGKILGEWLLVNWTVFWKSSIIKLTSSQNPNQNRVYYT